jgi:general secretion pathway protein E
MAAVDQETEEIRTPEKLIELRSALDDLVREGHVGQRDAEDILIAPRSKKELQMHPLEIIADRELDDHLVDGGKINIDMLTDWLCDASGQPGIRIDPLKVNVNKSTEVMSYAFAQRHNILAIDVQDEFVVVASAQPFMYQWESMLTQTLRGRRIERVVANPTDLARYTLEFYTTARSVAKATAEGLELSHVTNFEQMLELGQLKSPEANDAHIVNIVDWLLQYAFDQRASDIHIEPRRQ